MVALSAKRIGFIAVLAILGIGCGSQESWACTRGSGIGSTCGDDFTVEQCDYMGGDWHKGKTCKDLGYSPNG